MNDEEQQEKDKLVKMASQAEMFIKMGLRSTASLNVLSYAIRLYHAANAVMESELDKFASGKGREELLAFLVEMASFRGNEAFQLEDLLDNLKTSMDFVSAEINDDYSNYTESSGYRPPVAIQVPSWGPPKIRLIERGNSLVIVGSPQHLTTYMSGIHDLMRESGSSNRVIHFCCDQSVPQTLPKHDESLLTVRSPPSGWMGMANTLASCRRKIDQKIELLDDKRVDVILVDNAALAMTKPVQMDHELIVRSIAGVKELQEVARKRNAVLVIGIGIPGDMPPEDRAACLNMVSDQLNNSTITYKD
jgi:hypothetical protein